MSRYLNVRAMVAAGVAAPALVLASGLAAQAATTGGWHVIARGHYGPSGQGNALFSVTATSRTRAWAVGGILPNGPLTQGGTPLALSWNGRRWHSAALPAGLHGALFAVSASGPRNVWAVSALNGYALRWNGRKWSVAKRWPESSSLPAELTGVTAFSPRDVWVFGSSGYTAGLGTWHLHGRTWTRVTGLAGDITMASALSAKDMWAIGGTSAPQGAILRYRNGAWRQVTNHLLKGQGFTGLLAASAKNVWVSADVGHDATKPELLHFNGRRWRKLAMPWKLQLSNLTSDGHGGFWAYGQPFEAAPWVVHMSRTGAWTRYSTRASGPSAFALVPGTRSMWGAGSTASPQGGDATIWRR